MLPFTAAATKRAGTPSTPTSSRIWWRASIIYLLYLFYLLYLLYEHKNTNSARTFYAHVLLRRVSLTLLALLV